MKKILNFSQGFMFAIFVALVGILSLTEASNIFNKHEGSWITGEQTSKFEKVYDDHLPIKSVGVNVWAAIEYLLFKQGRSGVEIGQNEWLFSTEEFLSYTKNEDATNTNLETIESVAKTLSARGIELVIAVVPAKSRIYSEFLGDDRPSQQASDRYQMFTQQLEDRNLVWRGLKEPLLNGKDSAQTFLRTDTYWTPAGARIVANYLANSLEGENRDYLADSSQFITVKESIKEHEGDLMSFIPVRDYFPNLGPQPEQLTPEKTKQSIVVSDQTDSLFGDESPFNITLIGTSYSANSLWNFHGALQQYFGQEILNYSEDGQGPIIPMMKYLASEDYEELPPRLVIWEFPERFLPIEYDIESYTKI